MHRTKNISERNHKVDHLCVGRGGRSSSATAGGASRLEGVLLGRGAEGGGVELAQELRQLLQVGDGHEGQAELYASQLLSGISTAL